ncbi:hypothetical protein MKZ20_21805 [Psychrobacillus sp. FSL K6-2684]|uniref:hypothetical protein n=1 Tax=unclassified Psychrobacillus TaxID=2636677 RepID=UPI0030FAD122
MDNRSTINSVKRHYLYATVCSILGIFFTIYILIDRNPPVIVFVLSAISTAIIGGLIGVVISNFFEVSRLKKQ